VHYSAAHTDLTCSSIPAILPLTRNTQSTPTTHSPVTQHALHPHKTLKRILHTHNTPSNHITHRNTHHTRTTHPPFTKHTAKQPPTHQPLTQHTLHHSQKTLQHPPPSHNPLPTHTPQFSLTKHTEPHPPLTHHTIHSQTTPQYTRHTHTHPSLTQHSHRKQTTPSTHTRSRQHSRAHGPSNDSNDLMIFMKLLHPFVPHTSVVQHVCVIVFASGNVCICEWGGHKGITRGRASYCYEGNALDNTHRVDTLILFDYVCVRSW